MIKPLHWANLAVLCAAAYLAADFAFASAGEWFAPRDGRSWVSVALHDTRLKLERRSCAVDDCIAELRLEVPREDWNGFQKACVVNARAPEAEWPCFAGPRLDHRLRLQDAADPPNIKLYYRDGSARTLAPWP